MVHDCAWFPGVKQWQVPWAAGEVNTELGTGTQRCSLLSVFLCSWAAASLIPIKGLCCYDMWSKCLGEIQRIQTSRSVAQCEENRRGLWDGKTYTSWIHFRCHQQKQCDLDKMKPRALPSNLQHVGMLGVILKQIRTALPFQTLLFTSLPCFPASFRGVSYYPS